MGELDPLGPGRRAARVVDGGGAVLVLVLPRLRVASLEVHLGVSVGAEDDAVLDGEVGHRVGQLRVDQEHGGAGVLQDVLDLGGGEPEVDRHQHPAVAADAEERGEEASGVLGQHGHPLAPPDAALVEAGGLGPGQVPHPGVSDLPEAPAGCVGLVHDADPVAVDERGALEVAPDRERCAHAFPLVRRCGGR
jgi:hypothetical protein